MQFWPFKRKPIDMGSLVGDDGGIRLAEGYLGNIPGKRLYAYVRHTGIEWIKPEGRDELTIYMYKHDDGLRSFTWMSRLLNFRSQPNHLYEYVKDVIVWAEGGPLPKNAVVVERASSPTTQPWHYDG